MVDYWNFTLPKKPWLRGGVIGAALCVVLFLFYLFVFVPLTHSVYSDQIASTGFAPEWTTNIPLYTGHLIVAFYIEPLGGEFASSVCPKEPNCYSWSAADFVPNCATPWKMEGQNGCCTGLAYVPKEPCAQYVQNGTGIALSLLLVGIYFVVGAGVGWGWGRRKK
ncbi:MAG: hypothetical protein Q7R76_05525 [Candidatus Woesearchaeota archaeon]|nr:hypothetical protein [Candidatus Woesearchaeota archaeon]